MTWLPAKPPVPVLCANYSGPVHGSDQGNEAHVLSPGGSLREASKLGESGGSLNTVCHFSKFCFCFLFCFASWLLTLRKLQISRHEEQRSDHRCWSSREEVKPQRAAPGGWALQAWALSLSPEPLVQADSSSARRKEQKTSMALHCREDGGESLTSVQLTPVQTKPNKKTQYSSEHYRIQSLYKVSVCWRYNPNVQTQEEMRIQDPYSRSI